MRCIVVRSGDDLIRFRVPEAEARLGSGPAADIRVPYEGISRLHARVTPGVAGPVLFDLDSKNGIWVDGRKVRETVLLPGVKAFLGTACVTIEDGPTSDLEVGLRFPRMHRESGGLSDNSNTATAGVSFSSGDSLEAIKLVREVENGPGATGLERRIGILARARRVLGADTVALVSARPREAGAVHLLEGAPLTEALMEVLQRPKSEGGPSRTIQVLGAGDRMVMVTRRRGTAKQRLVAVLPKGVVALRWQQELFEFLSDHLAPGGLRALPEVLTDRFLSTPEAPARLVFPPEMVVGESVAIKGLYRNIAKTVRSALDVLLLGETGTGKELFARLIHLSGPMANGPFVAINCAAIPAELLEAELFGVQGRVATGVDPRSGRFLEADGGTLFLDEIGELASPLQAKLLRFLQEREVHPLGASHPRKLDVRVVSASNRDLPADVKEGRFRADLYYRLRGLQFHVPPLRDRLEDVPLLVAAFVERSSKAHDKRIEGLSRRALELLRAYSWPGNVRELESEIRRAVLVCPRGNFIQSSHLGPVAWALEDEARRPHPAGQASRDASPRKGPAVDDRRVEPLPSSEPARDRDDLNLRTRVEALERATIDEALRRAAGNRSQAARSLGLTRAGLAMKLRRLFGAGPK